MRKLQGNSLKLKIDDFGKSEELSNAIRNYYGLAVTITGKPALLCTSTHNMAIRSLNDIHQPSKTA